METTRTLYRPVGKTELALIAGSGYRAFPPRLFWQPIFYPVLTESYPTQIARDWNTRDAASGFEGHVTRFNVRAELLDRYESHRVGSLDALEYWIPAGELADFNAAIVGLIEVVASFRGTPGR
jgi:hypothetical protein